MSHVRPLFGIVLLACCSTLASAQPAANEARGDQESTPRLSGMKLGEHFRVRPDEVLSSLVAVGSNGVVDGTVENLFLVASEVRLGPHARITRHLVSLGSHVQPAPGAQVSAQQFTMTLPEGVTFWQQARSTQAEPDGFGWGLRVAWAIAALIACFVIGALYLHLFPTFHARNLARLSERPWVSLGYGLLHYVAIVPLAGLLLVTLIGILFLPVYFVLIGCLLWLGYITSAVWVGGLLLRRSTPGSWLELLLGLALFQGMALIPLPTGMISATLVAFGVGAVLQVCYRGIRRGGGSRELPAISHPHPA